jgi:hypothetical protein
MSKRWMVILVAGIFSACTDSGSGKIDVDKVGKKFDSSAKKLWDSTKVKGKELGNKVKEKLDNKK